MSVIDEIVSSTNQISASVYGGNVLVPNETEVIPGAYSRHRSGLIAMQVIPQTGDDFQVNLEGALVSESGEVFTTVGEYTQDDTRIAVFPPANGIKYRFRHVSGAACRVKIGG